MSNARDGCPESSPIEHAAAAEARLIAHGFSVCRPLIAGEGYTQLSDQIAAIGLQPYLLAGGATKLSQTARVEIITSTALAGSEPAVDRGSEDERRILLKRAMELGMEAAPALSAPVDVVIGGLGAVYARRMMRPRRLRPNHSGYGMDLTLAGFVVLGRVTGGPSSLRYDRIAARCSLVDRPQPPDIVERAAKDKWQPTTVLGHIKITGSRRQCQDMAEACVAMIGPKQIPVQLGAPQIFENLPNARMFKPLS